MKKSTCSSYVLFFVLSRSHTISSIYNLAEGNTPHAKRHISRTLFATPLKSIFEERACIHDNRFGITYKSRRRVLKPEKRLRDERHKTPRQLEKRTRCRATGVEH